MSASSEAWNEWRIHARRALADEMTRRFKESGTPIARAGEVLTAGRQSVYDKLAGSARMGVDEFCALAHWLDIDPAESLREALREMPPIPSTRKQCA